mgnify:CR=1 FL=1
MATTIEGNFWPSVYHFEMGGLFHFDFTVIFDGTPPSDFDYQVDYKDYQGNVIKTYSGTQSTGGQQQVQLAFSWNKKQEDEENEVENPYSYGTFRLYVKVSYGGQEFNQGICSGVGNGMPQDDDGDDTDDDDETGEPEPPENPEPSDPEQDPVDKYSGAHYLRAVDLRIPSIGMPLIIERRANSVARYPD